MIPCAFAERAAHIACSVQTPPTRERRYWRGQPDAVHGLRNSSFFAHLLTPKQFFFL